MAVQAQHPSLGEHTNRATQLSGRDLSTIDPRTLLAPIPYHGVIAGECQQQQQQVFMGGPAVEGMHRWFQHGLALPNFALYQPSLPQQPPPVAVDSTALTGGASKRRKESVDRRSSHLQQQLHNHLQLGVDLNQTLGSSAPIAAPQPAGAHVSTGLRLAFDDERSTVTSSRPDTTSVVALTLRDELSAQLSQHQEELNQLLRAQAEQLRQALEERTQRHSKALLATIEGDLSKKVQEKEMELERVSRRTLELEDTVRQLSMESQMWQSKAKNNEAMVAILRTNLQQAVLVQHQSREHSKLEGCGDSEADDAASAYIDNNPPAQQSRAMMTMIKAAHFSHSTNNNEVALMRACRRCRAKEATVVVLPCLHLCLCIACKDEVDRCPICSSHKSGGVEVFLS